jgi:hypothetical protein
VATVWLKQNWFIAPRAIKAYLLAAIFLLMFITSMGIFGYLSKAHMDQGLVSGDVQSKISVFDEKIKIAKENIDANRRALKQLDEAVDQVMGRSTSEQGAERSVQIRRQQGPERQRLIREIEAEQKKISSLNEERAPIAAEVRKVEAEVGPIKYIAALIYGDNPDANLLESAVRWVIIMIVIVFDPLAVILLLASQYSFAWFRQQSETQEKLEPVELKTETADPPNIEIDTNNENVEVPGTTPGERFSTQDDEIQQPKKIYEPVIQTVTPDEAFRGLPKATNFKDPSPEQIVDEGLKSAKQDWKANNPDSTIKKQELLKDLGVIDKLPWEDTIVEAPKKKNYMIKDQDQQVTKSKE